MEKITLKPNVKELIYKNDEDNVHFDVLSYQGSGNQEKMLGSLFVLGHIKYDEEDLGYAVSLISSLAKREYYSETSFQEQNPKAAFERMLKKLNEVLDDFFQNKNFKLNIGLAAISGDNIYISRLGKFKIALARDGNYIDVLNNIELFSKDTENEKQFANIISGKIQPNDKIFAYFPFRSITSREKQLDGFFVKEDQEGFHKKIAQLAANANNFACCGVHIDMRQIKEISVSPTTYARPTLLVKREEPREKESPMSQISPKTADVELTSDPIHEKPEMQKDPEEDQEETDLALKTEQTRIIPAEFLVSRRKNIFSPLTSGISKLLSAGRFDDRTRRRNFVVAAAIILLPFLLFALLKTGGLSSEAKNALKQADENIKLAQSRVTQNNTKDARALLQASLAGLVSFSDKKTDDIKQKINQTLDGIDHVSDKQPTLFADLVFKNKDFRAALMATLNNFVNTSDAGGTISMITPDETSQLGQIKTTPKFMFISPSFISIFNGSDGFGSYDIKSKKTNLFSLKDPASAYDAVLYENNLYVLSDNLIYKYADATTGGTKRVSWGGDNAIANQISITADGNVYTLDNSGKLLKYFKGKKVGESDLQVVPSPGSRILTFKDSAFIYLSDKRSGKVYVFDKASSALKTTYKFDSIGTILDITVSPDGTAWALSADNKIWNIK